MGNTGSKHSFPHSQGRPAYRMENLDTGQAAGPSSEVASKSPVPFRNTETSSTAAKNQDGNIRIGTTTPISHQPSLRTLFSDAQDRQVGSESKRKQRDSSDSPRRYALPKQPRHMVKNHEGDTDYWADTAKSADRRSTSDDEEQLEPGHWFFRKEESAMDQPALGSPPRPGNRVDSRSDAAHEVLSRIRDHC
ncbi:hypothetical protein M011DRAFT_460688 [Sporormia fimetaria CBS 119925]|uniref:Uncharacterized protein n=1 Tax=Sporormia fimetaria CBS 119925 TaxID=1340428 RepID=A0A6A6V282_9PLEO|nr:hypothetical protein M011DRAFT_460688 [Sporormia fimetaria CBS 119925]